MKRDFPRPQGRNVFCLACLVLLQACSVLVAQTNCRRVPAGAISWWKAENNTLDSIGLNDGQTMNGGVAYEPGEVGTAFWLSPTNSEVLIGDPADLRFSNSFSIETWINVAATPDAVQQLGQIFYRGNAAAYLDSYYLAVLPTGGLRFHILDDSGVGLYNANLETTPIGTGVWTHVAAILEAGVMRVYTNGQLAAQANANVTPLQMLNGGGVAIGNTSLAPGSSNPFEPFWLFSQPFTGSIDELTVYARALSAAEIEGVFNAGLSGKCRNPVAPLITSQPESLSVFVGDSASFHALARGDEPLTYQWLFNDSAMAGQTNRSLVLAAARPADAGSYSVLISNVAGSVTSSNALLTVMPAPTNCLPVPTGLISWWRGDGSALDGIGGNNGTWIDGASFAAGKVGQSFSFNGAGQVVLVPDAASLDPTISLTLESWINVTTFSQNDASAVMGKDNPYGSRQYMIGIANVGGNWVFRAHIGVPGGLALFNGATALQTNNWYHVAMTYDGAYLRLYVNGVQDGSLAVNGPVVTSTEALRIGGSVPGPWDFNGRIDEVSLFSVALSASQIQSIYSAGAAGKCPGSVAPSIISQPVDQTVTVGGLALLSVAASGSAPLSYQWQFNGSNVAGQTAGFLVLSNVQAANAGSYAVLVVNPAGSILSSNATLSVVAAPTNCVPAATGLVAWWRGEGNALDSAAENNGTLLNGVGFAIGKVGQAFSFNGAGQIVQVPDAPFLNPTSALTLEGWINVTAYSLNDAIAVAGKDNPYGGRQYMIGMANVDGQWVFRAHVGVFNGLEWFNGSTALETNTWYHVAMTYDGNYLRLYVNGIPDGNLAVTGRVVTSSEAMLIGGSVPGPWDFNGQIDELSLYEVALSESEVQSIYSAASFGKCAAQGEAPRLLTQPTSQTAESGSTVSFDIFAIGQAPLSYQWLFDGVIVSLQTNSSLVLTNLQPTDSGQYSVMVSNSIGAITSSNAVLTVVGPPPTNCISSPSGLIGWWRAEGNALDSAGQNNGTSVNGASFAAGEVGEAFLFNGTNQVVQVPDGPALNPTNALTLEAWVNINAFSGNDAIAVAGKDNPYGSRQYMIGMAQVDGRWVFRAHVGVPGGLELFNGSAGLQTNTWYHVAMTYDGAYLRLFVNGMPDGSLAVTGAVVTSSESLIIGGSVPGPWDLNGQIDELSLYGRALSSAEIQAIYNAGNAGKCPIPPNSPMPAVRLLSSSRSIGTFEVRFSGMPNQTYRLQRAFGISGPWLSIGSLTLDPTGAGTYTDTNSAFGTAYYRLNYH
jgi:hypothetical protein